MFERLAGAVVRGIGVSVCRTLDLHAPDHALKSNGLFVYGKCRFCGTIITRTGPGSWRVARDVDDDYLREMRDISI